MSEQLLGVLAAVIEKLNINGKWMGPWSIISLQAEIFFLFGFDLRVIFQIQKLWPVM